MTGPYVRNCDLCFLADDVLVAKVGAEWVYTCTNHDPAHTWSTPAPVPTKPKQAKASQSEALKGLGVHDDLLACIHSDDPWLEYGVIEQRYRLMSPDTYEQLVEKHSHSARNAARGGPDDDPAGSGTVSQRLVRVLSVLADQGLISRDPIGKPTGYWATYLSKVSYWGPMPPSARTSELTWEQYAIGHGLDHMKWVLPDET